MSSYYGMVFGFRIANLVWWVDHGWMLGSPKAPLLLSSSGGWERKYNKSLTAIKIGTQRDISAVTVPGKTDLICGSQLNL